MIHLYKSTKTEKDHLSNGMFWHYLASVLNPKIGKDLDIKIPFPTELSELNQKLLKIK